MPIQLDKDFTTPNFVKITPKFFSNNITGSGKNSGLLNNRIHPHCQPSYFNAEVDLNDPFWTDRKRRVHGEGMSKDIIPVGTTRPKFFHNHNGHSFTDAPGIIRPAKDQMLRLTVDHTKGTASRHLYLNLTPQTIIIREDDTGERKLRHLGIAWRCELISIPYDEENSYDTKDDPILVRNAHFARKPVYIMPGVPYATTAATIAYTFDPMSIIEVLGHDDNFTSYYTPLIDESEIEQWMEDFDVYQSIVDQGHRWSENGIVEDTKMVISSIKGTNSSLKQVTDKDSITKLVSHLHYLENHNVSLDAYRQIYNHLVESVTYKDNKGDEIVDEDFLQMCSNINVNLLLCHVLNQLDSMKDQLPTPTINVTAKNNLPSFFSPQQKNAIATDKPLTLVQAGAGTGKSTVILARIQYLIDCGIDPHDITVCSFTNAAADHIKEKNPNVNSMTIARMIHDIYSNNFTHELSSLDTIMNSIDILLPDDKFAYMLRHHLFALAKKDNSAMSLLTNFIEQHIDETLEVLNCISQTCLELEIIIAYILIDKLEEPSHIKAKYLIIDEVQDNSLFEFIYALKYVAKNEQNLFIVGDASQTLYEFRASNPKALNSLEASGVFATYQLTTNYRSNQAILDFANVHLKDIDANQFAQIQLRANSLKQITAQEFIDKVHLEYRYSSSLGEFRDNLPAYVHNIMKPYIDDCLARNEQVAFLAHDRFTVGIVQKELESIYPNTEIRNITVERRNSTTIFSNFIKKYWDQVTQVPQLTNVPWTISNMMNNHIDDLSNGRMSKSAKQSVSKMISDWWMEYHHSIKRWIELYNQGINTETHFFNKVRASLMEFEIRHNAIREALMQKRNKERKERNLNSKAPIVVSTIHGAKGLEFDNVVVVHRYKSAMEEADKRMYYVAFTRAINTELILSHGTVKNPRIEADYHLIAHNLLKKERIDLLRKQGQPVDDMEIDEVELALKHMLKQAENDEELSQQIPTVKVSTRSYDLRDEKDKPEVVVESDNKEDTTTEG